MPVPRRKKPGSTRPSRIRKRESATDRIVHVSKGSRLISICIYGRSGSGKTTIAASFPKPALIIGAEDGTLSVHNIKGLDFILIEKSSDIVELKPAFSKYKTLILDTASSLQSLILKEVLGLQELPPQLSWGIASRQDWGQVTTQTKELLRLILDQPCHKVIIAQERQFDSDEESEIIIPHVGAALSPSVVNWLNPAVDYIGQTFIREREVESEVKVKSRATGKTRTKKVTENKKEYCMRIGPDAVYTTKFRRPKDKGSLPEVMIDPDYKSLMELIN